ncbi:unnamed protein product [Psylliodes chrysocephalus]|uniref:Uncharacterized protein n=1 Tax=Psylliodes chrysocephalus TaxID=3402493 RepID=A0A9P0GGL3_9CUCU|nr:unnamed protein product [Psylliodes chrysocephala]
MSTRSDQLRCRLYDNRIKITKKKLMDLQELTSVLSKEVKDFYSSLAYQSEDKNQGNKKAKQKTESDESENNQEKTNLEETSSKNKATNLKSTTKCKNKGNEEAKQKTESDDLKKKQEIVSNSEIRHAKKKPLKRKSATRTEENGQFKKCT